MCGRLAARRASFAHKAGSIENYASDAGIVGGIAPRAQHFIVAVTSNLGTRYAPGEPCCTNWRLPVHGAAIDAAMSRCREPYFPSPPGRGPG